MIDISENLLQVLLNDGSVVPFDANLLQKKILTVCTENGITDSATAQNIALSIEFALMCSLHRKGNAAEPVKKSEIDAIIVRLLEDTGYSELAEDFRKTVEDGDALPRIRPSEIHDFLSDNFHITGAELDSLAQKVNNTLRAIGSENPAQALILELAVHFRELAAGQYPLNITTHPDFKEHTGSSILLEREQLTARVTEEFSKFLTKRILAVYPVNRIFPSVRVDLRLNGLMNDANLKSPLTELALAPAFVRAARCIDELCLAADTLCAERELTGLLPLPLLLTLSDASIFTREQMECKTPEASEKCAVELASMLTLMLARQPFKILCK